MTEEIEITKRELDELKYKVLKEKQDEISEQLGDPGRYFASFKAKDFISHTDTEEINAEKTSIQRTNLLIEKILGEKCNKRGRMNEHPFDVFVAALRRMRVHIHIVKILNNELATKKGELYSSKRTQIKLREFQNGFPSNGVTTGRVPPPSNLPQTPSASSMASSIQSSSDNESSSLVSKGPFPLQSNNSSPISSSSVASSHETTPPILSSPQTDTDGSVLSSPLIPPVVSYTRTSPHSTNDVLPTLPTGYNESGQRVQVDGNTSPQSGSNVLEQLGDPIPVLPPGFNSDGRKIDDISEFLTPKDPIHPDHGPMPTSSPQSDFNVIQKPHSHSNDTQDDDTIAELKLMISSLQAEVTASHDRISECENEISHLRKWNEELRSENSKLKTAHGRLESFVRVVTGKDHSDSVATTPHPKYGNWPGSNRKRNTEPSLHPGYGLTHRQSETSMLSVPTRPNKLPLNMKNGNVRTSNSQPNSYSHDISPGYINQYTSSSQRSPASMDHYSSRGVPKKLSSSRDDLTSGGEDGSSVRSFDSGNSGNVTLANQISATETIV